MRLEGNIALVTGGSRGIGRAVCAELARQGASVAINYAGNSAAAEETAALCRQLGVEAEIVQADISSPAACEEMTQGDKALYGRFVFRVTNAGIPLDGLLLTAKEEDFVKTLDTNLKGAYFCTQAASKVMLRQKYGRIICLSSIVGLRGNPGQTAYAASKAGILGLVKAAAKELASRDITVNAVAPGFIETDMTAVLPEKAKTAMLSTIPKGRPGSPEDVARAVAFFAAPECAYITGQVLCVDGGMAV